MSQTENEDCGLDWLDPEKLFLVDMKRKARRTEMELLGWNGRESVRIGSVTSWRVDKAEGKGWDGIGDLGAKGEFRFTFDGRGQLAIDATEIHAALMIWLDAAEPGWGCEKSSWSVRVGDERVGEIGRETWMAPRDRYLRIEGYEKPVCLHTDPWNTPKSFAVQLLSAITLGSLKRWLGPPNSLADWSHLELDEVERAWVSLVAMCWQACVLTRSDIDL